jgi:hypothetical protein
MKDVNGRTDYQAIESAATFKAIFAPLGLHPPFDERNNTPQTGAAFAGSRR